MTFREGHLPLSLRSPLLLASQLREISLRRSLSSFAVTRQNCALELILEDLQMTDADADAVKLDDAAIAANDLKTEGNGFLTKHKYATAAEKYTLAIDLLPSAILYSNRAQALIKLESYGLAIQDANDAIK